MAIAKLEQPFRVGGHAEEGTGARRAYFLAPLFFFEAALNRRVLQRYSGARIVVNTAVAHVDAIDDAIPKRSPALDDAAAHG